MYNDIKNLLPDNILFFDEPLKKHSTFRIGGSADLLVAPQTEEQLEVLFKYINDNAVRYVVIGNGSNLLFRDEGFRGIVVKLGSEFSGISASECAGGMLLSAKAGTLLSKLAFFAAENSLTGLEFAAGIPGNVGGAVLMNAGAYDGEIAFVLKESRFFDTKNLCFGIKTYDEHDFSYRHSSYQDDGLIILSATFILKTGDKEEIFSKIKDLNNRRTSKQPLEFPSAGSTFKRPEGYFAGKLIEDSGLKGYCKGGAMVSEKHCGFVINTGDATCEDVLCVIKYVQDTVFEKFGVNLETEVKIIEA
ncbi:MAG: UDP-N-acetylmuramate dehydrogenase [Ruminococcaceae bacterium]|nr:UDP-N-acetylmuramate dehydrogenase [Oscillospiraceae bacterium]